MLGGTLFQIKWNTVPCKMERCYMLDGYSLLIYARVRGKFPKRNKNEGVFGCKFVSHWAIYRTRFYNKLHKNTLVIQ